ncbi:MAG: DNA/RNA nuclease SfsA [Aestuariivita sp.]|nr:DNA/RNA nuclease SfsA [Aestuariivita sp.]MCY4345774.1 DNA/RNA nuclease SfsA [Aestuariivita sp.]
MRFERPLISARLIRRYKRFLADCELANGEHVTAHCANPGSMMNLTDPGTQVWLEPNENPKKKLKFGWRLTQLGDHLVGVDTSVPNRILRHAFEARQVSELAQYSIVKPEVRFGDHSRIDFLLTHPSHRDAYVEIKSVTLSRSATVAEFPDAVTARGTRHLNELTTIAKSGDRAVIFFLMQRTDCSRVTVATDIDPLYAAALEQARLAGVEILAYGTHITLSGIELSKRIPFDT